MRPQAVPAKSWPKKTLPCADIRLPQSELKNRLNLVLTPLGYPWQQPKVRESQKVNFTTTKTIFPG